MNMTETVRYQEDQIWIERYRALTREVTDPLAAGLLRDIVLELEAKTAGQSAQVDPTPVTLAPRAKDVKP
jgi:hypothetical protein